MNQNLYFVDYRNDDVLLFAVDAGAAFSYYYDQDFDYFVNSYYWWCCCYLYDYSNYLCLYDSLDSNQPPHSPLRDKLFWRFWLLRSHRADNCYRLDVNATFQNYHDLWMYHVDCCNHLVGTVKRFFLEFFEILCKIQNLTWKRVSELIPPWCAVIIGFLKVFLGDPMGGWCILLGLGGWGSSTGSAYVTSSTWGSSLGSVWRLKLRKNIKITNFGDKGNLIYRLIFCRCSKYSYSVSG